MEITPEIMTSLMTFAQEHPEELNKVVAIVQAQGAPLEKLLDAVNTIFQEIDS
jgi:type VI protein secretion system component VasK